MTIIINPRRIIESSNHHPHHSGHQCCPHRRHHQHLIVMMVIICKSKSNCNRVNAVSTNSKDNDDQWRQGQWQGEHRQQQHLIHHAMHNFMRDSESALKVLLVIFMVILLILWGFLLFFGFASGIIWGVLFSILAGNSYTSLYSQNEAIFCALFAEVSEAKALMEQIALVCSGRRMIWIRREATMIQIWFKQIHTLYLYSIYCIELIHVL